MAARGDPAVEFFYKHAGWGYMPGKETKAQGRRRGAILLARAEKEAQRRGWKVKWMDSETPYEMMDAEDEMPKEVLDAVLYDSGGKVLGGLGQIGDPSREYGRVVEAELALEALHEAGHDVRQETLPFGKKRRHRYGKKKAGGAR
jgi:hypothetical protein